MGKITVWALALCISAVAAANQTASEQELTASQIVEKNVAARGGLDAWRKVQTMVWIGHIESDNAPAPNLPFILQMKRPNKTRFELKTQSQTSVRMYDGTYGWKLRRTSHGMPDVQPYTPDELSFARDGQGIDGLLVDYQAKGIVVALDGIDEVEGRKAYRLSVKLPSGNSHHVWVDAKTFLDIKYDRVSRNTLGQSSIVSVFYRNFKTVGGLEMPLTIETSADNAKTPDKMVIDSISLNTPLEDMAFGKPSVAGHRNASSNGNFRPQAARSMHQGFP